jgi:hypothetical protein
VAGLSTEFTRAVFPHPGKQEIQDGSCHLGNRVELDGLGREVSGCAERVEG